MNSPGDSIEKLLREQDAHLPDDGFTRRVMARLPRRRSLLPKAVLLMVALVGAVVMFYWMPLKNLPPLDYRAVFASDSNVSAAWLPVAAVLTALVSAARMALRRED
jgi:hypothetical protein